MAGAMPQDHAQRLLEQKPLSRRARWLAFTGGLAVVLVVVLAIVLTTGGRVQRGCIHAFLPGAMGAEETDACGATARQTCATFATDPQFSGVDRRLIADACRKGHVPIG